MRWEGALIAAESVFIGAAWFTIATSLVYAADHARMLLWGLQ